MSKQKKKPSQKPYYKVIAKAERDCGHKHKTLEAAEKCRLKLLNLRCDHGVRTGKTCYKCSSNRAKYYSVSADWCTAKVIKVG